MWNLHLENIISPKISQQFCSTNVKICPKEQAANKRFIMVPWLCPFMAKQQLK
jgi:hypothetical protein